MRMIGYARVSMQDQNLDLQIDALKAANCEPIFTDKMSGAVDDRKGLEEALKVLEPGDTLVVWKLDRLGRSLTHLVETVNGLKERGVEFESLTEKIDTSTSTGKLVFYIFAALAEFVRDTIRERTQAGLLAARSRGKLGGRPTKLKGRKLELFLKLHKEKYSKEDICSMTGVSQATFYRYLRNQ